jgi:glycosyltransferase involved in cell wall biosynthesis
MYLGEMSEDKELVGIYNLASLFCNLSLYEGFGFTILEAQKCGIPVVCSDIPAHREMGKDTVAYVPPCSVDRIAESLYNVLTDKNLYQRLVIKGYTNVERFRWEKTAKETTEIYKSISK